MSMPAISLHQPHASLCVTRRPCDIFPGRHDPRPCGCQTMVKTLETRSWPCPPNLIGQRIAIHATQRSLDGTYGDWQALGGFIRHMPSMGDWLPLPLGAIVGSATIEACLPMLDLKASRVAIADRAPHLWVDHAEARIMIWRPDQYPIWSNVSDQLPYGDYRPGRYAWLLTDAAPVQERCPWCWGEITDVRGCSGFVLQAVIEQALHCLVCNGAGHCEPISARGRQRIWRWTP